ncbi:hypothetical protein CR165_22180 [Pseudoroseomonas aestuarii]|uniref:Uncharacterized protein n=1 Tax=Teichococcus aestuarii TaxID=568898 RepID=A0A2U1UYC5_9PROT|nr:hypothetical protein CR165_22180 [Pseudoroseomonas aestuarii]
MRSMTKPAVGVAREALAVGRQTFPAYGSRTSRHDFTQAQLFALLTLRRKRGRNTLLPNRAGAVVPRLQVGSFEPTLWSTLMTTRVAADIAG